MGWGHEQLRHLGLRGQLLGDIHTKTGWRERMRKGEERGKNEAKCEENMRKKRGKYEERRSMNVCEQRVSQ